MVTGTSILDCIWCRFRYAWTYIYRIVKIQIWIIRIVCKGPHMCIYQQDKCALYAVLHACRYKFSYIYWAGICMMISKTLSTSGSCMHALHLPPIGNPLRKIGLHACPYLIVMHVICKSLCHSCTSFIDQPRQLITYMSQATSDNTSESSTERVHSHGPVQPICPRD